MVKKLFIVLAGFVLASFLFSVNKALFFLIFFMGLTFFWSELIGRFETTIGYLIYLDIHLTLGASIIMGYFYGIFYGFLTAVILSGLDAFYDPKEKEVFSPYKSYFLVHILIGVLAGLFNFLPFYFIGVLLLIVKYSLTIYFNFDDISIDDVFVAIFNIILFGLLFLNHENLISNIFT